jgi:hypothetical protein
VRQERDEDAYRRDQQRKARTGSGADEQEVRIMRLLVSQIGAPPGKGVVTPENREAVISWLALNNITRPRSGWPPNQKLEAAYNNPARLREWRDAVNPHWRRERRRLGELDF